MLKSTHQDTVVDRVPHITSHTVLAIRAGRGGQGGGLIANLDKNELQQAAQLPWDGTKPYRAIVFFFFGQNNIFKRGYIEALEHLKAGREQGSFNRLYATETSKCTLEQAPS